MLFSITHRTKLDYSAPISESVMEVRAMPRTDERQVLRQFEIEVSPVAKAVYHTDWLGNTVHQFSILGQHERVTIESKGTIETRPQELNLGELVAPLSGLIRDHRSWDFLQLEGPVIDDPALPALADKIGLAQAKRVGEAIERVLSRTRDVISYKRGVTTVSSTVSDVIKSGAGVCQDFSHLSLALLRRAGVPCRYVSGYLNKAGAPEVETHAWIEAFVPGVGWIGIDPTHGSLVTEDYVAVAVGRSYADVPPNRGVFRGDAEEKIDVAVAMEQLEERARLTPYSTALDRPRKSVRPSAPVQPQRLGLGLEQQLKHPTAVGLVVQQQRQQQQ